MLGWWAVTPRLWELASEPEWRYVNALRVGYWIQWMLNLIKGGHTIILHPLTRQKEAEYQQWIPYPRHFFWGVTRTSGCSRLGGAFIWISMLERTVKNVGIIISENRNTMRYNCASNLNFIFLPLVLQTAPPPLSEKCMRYPCSIIPDLSKPPCWRGDRKKSVSLLGDSLKTSVLWQ